MTIAQLVLTLLLVTVALELLMGDHDPEDNDQCQT